MKWIRHGMGLVVATCGLVAFAAFAKPSPDGDGSVTVTAERKVWHPVTLTLAGPFAVEQGTTNPFAEFRFEVAFRHESGSVIRVPGYFAADGNAANTSATEGTSWRAHLTPDKPGKWTWTTTFVRGPDASTNPTAKVDKLASWDGLTGSFEVAKSDKTGRDFRHHGRLEAVGKHYFRFAGSGDYYLKLGPDGPETFLAYTDFDGTEGKKPGMLVRGWEPHVKDWVAGDPTWQKGKGKGLIGAFNYLAAKGCNGISFLTYNTGGDGDNVWPFTAHGEKRRYDCSKLDQWRIAFEHAQTRGIALYFELQEQENDDSRVGRERKHGTVPAALDGGELGPERKAYHRELVARFAHLPAVVWNLGEENTHTPDEMKAIAAHLRETDPYHHPIVVHTFPQDQDAVYGGLLAGKPALDGAALQNHWKVGHQRVKKWVAASAAAKRPWAVGSDEQGTPDLGVPPDPGYAGQNGKATDKEAGEYDLHDIRKYTLWGTLTAGGYGVEYYFGNKLPQSDKNCEDFRSRDKSWDYGRFALELFRNEKLPFWEMVSADELVGNLTGDNSRYAFAKPGEVYLVYLPVGGEATLDLESVRGDFQIGWFNPRTGGTLTAGSVATVQGPGKASLGKPPADPDQDWVVLVRGTKPTAKE